MEWISVKDRMPDSYDDVLVLEGDEYRVAWWDGGVWNSAYGPAVTEEFVNEWGIEYWIPIPHKPRRLWNEINNGEI